MESSAYDRQCNDENNKIGQGPQPIAVPMANIMPRQDEQPMRPTTKNDHPEKSTTV